VDDIENGGDQVLGKGAPLARNVEDGNHGGDDDDVADQHEGAELAEAAIGLVQKVTDDWIGDAVPDTHQSRDQADHDSSEAENVLGVERIVAKEQHGGIGGGVVHDEQGDLPDLGPVVLDRSGLDCSRGGCRTHWGTLLRLVSLECHADQGKKMLKLTKNLQKLLDLRLMMSASAKRASSASLASKSASSVT